MSSLESPISSMDAAFRGFACPQEQLTETVLDLVSGEMARETTRRLLDQNAQILNQHGFGIIDLLESWLGMAHTEFHSTKPENRRFMSWHDAFSKAYNALSSADQAVALQTSTDLALHLATEGMPCNWVIDQLVPRRLQWGHLILPPAQHISVSSTGTAAVVQTALETQRHEINLTRTQDQWFTDSDFVISLPQIGTKRLRITLSPEPSLDDSFLANSLPPAVRDIGEDLVDLWQDSIALISEYAPIYDSWVQNVIRKIALLDSPAGVVHSGSYPDRYGFIHASARSSPMSLAELLVHESAHQYFNLLTRLGPVEDGTDTNMYYSPLVGTKRPIDRILFAYHACANILLLYRLCKASGVPDDGYCDRHEELVLGQLEDLKEPLHDNPALTWTGRIIFEPLFERLP